MPTNRFHLRPIAIIAASILILGGAIYGVLMTIARVGDEHQRVIEQRIVTSALDQQRVKLSGMLVQQAYWDLGYDEISDHLDVTWADANFGRSGEMAGVPLSAIFDSHTRPIYRFSTPATASDAVAIAASPSLAVLVDRALAAPTLPPRPITAFVRVRTTLYFAAAQRIVPNDARALHPLARHYVLTYLLPVDAAMLKSFQLGFNVAALALAPSPAPKLANVALVNATGAPLAWLSWRSARPGKDFANAAAPLAISCFALLAALQLVVLRWWMEVAQKVHDEAVGRTAFLANVSHELRTPLNAIIGFSDCMADEMFGPLSPRYREYARDIKSSGQLLLGIVNDVLDLTHLTSIAEVIMQPVKPAEALAGAVRMLREYAKCDEISINYTDRSGQAEVAANDKALSQILLNLGSNAVKFSAPKSSVDVIVERAGDWLDIIVRDRGQGIAPDKLRLVGQPFFQAHTSSRKPGSGLGLAIVKKLTERLGGEFSIDSALGVGTTTRVRLPILRSTAPSSRTRVAA